MLASADKACHGFLVLAALQDTPFTKQGLLEAVALQKNRTQALAWCLFCGMRGSKTQCGSGEVAPNVSLQALASIHPCGTEWHKTLPPPAFTPKSIKRSGVGQLSVGAGAALLPFFWSPQQGFLQHEQAGFLGDLAISCWAFHHPSSYPVID